MNAVNVGGTRGGHGGGSGGVGGHGDGGGGGSHMDGDANDTSYVAFITTDPVGALLDRLNTCSLDQ